MIEIGELFGGADDGFASNAARDAKSQIPPMLRPVRGIVIASILGIFIWIGAGFAIWYIFF